MDRIEAFIDEIVAVPEYRAALATDPSWASQIAGILAGLIALQRLADEDTRALDLYDEVQSVIASGDSMKKRLLAVGEISVRASRLFDPSAWGGAADSRAAGRQAN